jgi:hypothetical protein
MFVDFERQAASTHIVASYVSRVCAATRSPRVWSHSCSLRDRLLTTIDDQGDLDMRANRSVSIAVFLFVALMAGVASAQQATIVGVVTDESKAVLPGVTVTVSDVAKGTQVVVVTDARGEYRVLQLTPGEYKLQAQLEGFSSVVEDKIALLVGQNVSIPITMKVATISETLTVTGQSPLVDTRSTQVAGNVNPTQMLEVPLLGRNWLELAKMVPGMTSNVINATNPGVNADNWAMNLDGQAVGNKTSQGLGQPKFSREAIAEYQVVTNLYDVTQGGSTGVQLQAITKSGTNALSGSGYGFFRDDKLNAPDAVSGTVLPYRDEQMGGTVGGPIIKDKLHYFMSYEYERTPNTIFNTIQTLGQTSSIPDTQLTNSLLLRVDDQLTKNDRLSVRGTYSNFTDPNYLGSPSNTHESQAADETQGSFNILGTWSKVLSTSAVQELRIGLKHYTFSYVPLISDLASPELDFPGLVVGPVNWMPQWHAQDFTSARYDLSLHHASHDLKIGAEYTSARMWDNYHVLGRGQMTFTSLPADIAQRIPASEALNPAAWNLTGLDPIAQRFNINYPKTSFEWVTPDPQVALWIGDNWRMSNNLTVNYGMRYTNYWYGATAPGITPNSIPITQYSAANAPTTNIPFMAPGDFGYKVGVHDNLDFGPQGGFAWNVGGANDLVIRGGSGLYYTVYEKSNTKTQILTSNLFSAQFNNNGTNPDFVGNPTNGVNSYDEAILLKGVPQSGSMSNGNLKMPMTWQSGVGFAKQLGQRASITADVVYRKTLRELQTIYPNLYYDPTTGYNLNPSKGVPNTAWGQISNKVSSGYGEYSALQTAFTRRVGNRVEGGASYTLMFDYKDTLATANNPFNYLDGEYATSTQFQRNTLRGWVNYELPWDIAIAGTYSYGSGNQYAATIATNPYGGTVSNRLNLLANGAAAPAIIVPAAMLSRWEGPAIIASGVVIPRDALMGTPYNRMDLRLTKSVRLGNSIRASIIGEVFNVFNYANYTAFNTSLSPTSLSTTSRFGLPTAADVSRQGQLGFRVTF